MTGMDVSGRRLAADVVLWALVASMVALEVFRPNGPDGWTRWVLVAGLPLLAVAVRLGRSAPLAALAVPVALSLVLSAELFTTAFSLAMLVMAYLVGVRAEGTRPALALFGAVCAVGLLPVLATSADLWTWFTLVLTVVLNLVFPWMVGRYRRHYAGLVRAGWELAERLEREQHLVSEQTRLRERSRIAGDMHDSLGHELSLIALRAGALEVAPELSEKRRRAAGELRAAAGAATERLHEIIHVLREDGEQAPTVPAQDTVEDLVERAAASGMAVRLEPVSPGAEPVGAELAPMARRALYRVVQEALTNASKHAPGAEVVVRLVPGPQYLLATVENAARPAGPLPGAVSSGTGLVGLDERVRLAGGTLDSGPRPGGGFAVSARLPVAGGAVLPAERGGPPPSTSARELAAARRQVRRRLWEALVVPLAVCAAVGVLMLGFQFYVQHCSVLDRQAFDGLRVGDSRSAVLPKLPKYELDEIPQGAAAGEPAGASCRYYRITAYSASPAYRLCFAEGRLVVKERAGSGP
ncbi:sensor histidine kinase [Streptomyces sp. NPDC057011]|uniref:sensor histidine kinase n=1 Tax=unclassified Streptomyces TaxID=2593676 RepID=UPI0036322475